MQERGISRAAGAASLHVVANAPPGSVWGDLIF